MAARQAQVPIIPAVQDLSGYASAASVALLAQNMSDSFAAVPQYVGAGVRMTVAQMKANFPAAAATLGKLCKVSDLWGSVATTMVCEQDTTGSIGYYWRPQRTDYATATSTATGGSMTLTPLVNAPSIIFKAALVSALTLNLATTDVWPGCRFEITAPSSLGLNLFTIAGLLGGLTTTLLGGAKKTAIYTTSNGWEAS